MENPEKILDEEQVIALLRSSYIATKSTMRCLHELANMINVQLKDKQFNPPHTNVDLPH